MIAQEREPGVFEVSPVEVRQYTIPNMTRPVILPGKTLDATNSAPVATREHLVEYIEHN